MGGCGRGSTARCRGNDVRSEKEKAGESSNPYPPRRYHVPAAAGSAMLDDGDVGAPGAGRRPDGFALEDAELAWVEAAEGRGRIGRDIGIVAGAVNRVAVGLVGPT